MVTPMVHSGNMEIIKRRHCRPTERQWEKDFERKKKVLISNEVSLYDNIEVVNEMIIDNILFDGELKTNVISVMKELEFNELKEIIKNLNLENITKVIIEKNTKKQ